MDAQTHTNFTDIVLSGALVDKGMGSFVGILEVPEVERIHAYLIDAAWSNYEQQRSDAESNQPDDRQ